MKMAKRLLLSLLVFCSLSASAASSGKEQYVYLYKQLYFEMQNHFSNYIVMPESFYNNPRFSAQDLRVRNFDLDQVFQAFLPKLAETPACQLREPLSAAQILRNKPTGRIEDLHLQIMRSISCESF